jgi:glycosyltransferase involved in cell wall biosynthesis
LLIHDYAGHPFAAELGRWAAGRGHQVLHAHAGDVETPRGALIRRDDDPDGLRLEPWSLGRPLPKYGFTRRWLRERRYGALAARRVAAFAPDVILSANAPPWVQAAMLAAARRCGAAFVAWVQDIVSLAAARALPAAVPVLGHLAAGHVRRQEFSVLAASDRVVVITEDFVPLCIAGGVAARKLAVIPNWAPLAEMTPPAGGGDWARRHGLGTRPLILYAGTLGLKHDPSLLADLAAALPEADIAVASQGLGRDWLETARSDRGLANLHLFDFQPYEDLPAMLAAADLVLAVLEPYAGILSVPSKILSYLVAGRPILAAIPPENLAARTVREAGAGLVVAPGDRAAFITAARALVGDEARRRALGTAGRRHAETAFAIDRIGPRFLDVLGERT